MFFGNVIASPLGRGPSRQDHKCGISGVMKTEVPQVLLYLNHPYLVHGTSIVLLYCTVDTDDKLKDVR